MLKTTILYIQLHPPDLIDLIVHDDLQQSAVSNKPMWYHSTVLGAFIYVGRSDSPPKSEPIQSEIKNQNYYQSEVGMVTWFDVWPSSPPDMMDSNGPDSSLSQYLI